MDYEYLQNEAAQAWRLSPAEWRQTSSDDQARMMAHELIKSVRESFAQEKLAAKGEQSKGSVNPMFAQMKARAGM